MKRKITINLEIAEKTVFLLQVEQQFHVRPIFVEDGKYGVTTLSFEVERGEAFEALTEFLEECDRQRIILGYDPEDETVIEAALVFLEAQTATPGASNEKEIYQVALEGVQLLADASEAPFYHLELDRPPALLFPVRNAQAELTYWVEVLPTATGLSLLFHRKKPSHSSSLDQLPQTTMTTMHVQAGGAKIIVIEDVGKTFPQENN